MSKRIKKTITISIIAIVIIIAIIATYFIVKNRKNQENIKNVLETYTENAVQNRLDNDKATNADDLILKIYGETIIQVF